MGNLIEKVSGSLLESTDVNDHTLELILGKAIGRHIESADLYLQKSIQESWYLEEGVVKESDFSIDRGFGLRVISGEKIGYSYSDDINIQALSQAASSAKSIVYSGSEGAIARVENLQIQRLYPDENPLMSLAENDKVALLHEIDQAARSLDVRVKEVMVRLSAEYETILMMNSAGLRVADIRPIVSLTVRVIVEENGRQEEGFAGGGARGGYEFFRSEDRTMQYVKKAVRQALTNLEAIPAPAGLMTVVVGPGWPAVLLHEAIGHGLEGDFNRKGSSAFSKRLGEKVASELCTIVDDGTLPGRRGSLSVDDEGTPGQNTVLIEKGILKQYMQDQLNAKLMKVNSTGNGRRESYAHPPMPRMTNTYMLPGESEPNEIIASVERGIYAADFSGGQVDITSGKFVFVASEAYLIENGKLTRPIKGASLVGDGPDILTKVTMVGNDLQLDSGIGSCGKGGQTVPVGVGQPTLKIEAVTVGGSQ